MQEVFIKTFGCQMNDYDSQRMLDLLRERVGLRQGQDPAQADVIILNTCSVRDKAEEKVFSELGMIRPLKTKNPKLIIAVGGCVASQEGQAIVRRAPFVDIVFGPQTLHRLPDLIRQAQNQRKAVVDISFPEIEKFDALPPPRVEGPTAFLSIMEGCSKYCTYCIVPYTRGEEISRPLDDVLDELVALTDQGVREVTFLGQNVNDYCGPRHDGTPSSLAELIRYAASLPEIFRIRYTTSHPLAFSDDLIETYAEEPKLANHVHLPVQSGSNRVLGMMKRGYTVERFCDRVERLRRYRPDICISSDFIVGFPGEMDEDFEQTLDLIRHIGFDQSFSFIYSPRPGTPAATLNDHVSMELKKERLARLQDLLSSQAHAVAEQMVGTIQHVLITGLSQRHEGVLTARADNNRVIHFEGDPSWVGHTVSVRVTEKRTHTLRGTALASTLATSSTSLEA